jgi:two-component system sensor kinase FixL
MGKMGEWLFRSAVVLLILQALVIGVLAYVILRRRRREESQRTAGIELEQKRLSLSLATFHAAIGEITSSIAHELNEPLTSIMSNSQAAIRFLNKEHVDLNEVRAILNDIASDTTRTSEMILRMHDSSKSHHSQFQSIDLNQVVRRVLLLVDDQMSAAKIKIRTDLMEDLPQLLGDQAHLELLVWNLLMNSLDAVAHVREHERTIQIKTWKTDVEIQLSVHGTGKGIDPERFKYIFHPFLSAKTRGPGIGLPISKSIVQAHSGRMWAENITSASITYYCSFPINQSSQ